MTHNDSFVGVMDGLSDIYDTAVVVDIVVCVVVVLGVVVGCVVMCWCNC